MPVPKEQRNYQKEYANETPERRKQRVMRNAARRAAVAKHGKSALKGKHVDHITPLIKGGTNEPSNRRIISAKANMSRKRK